ncbi:lysozyme inhibitor LprI family protein [Burkholderia sp. 22PA0099]|uniref:lysozyme inhibitor LprI family protein n=1 Tax=Burkholderia sp. 22PA0099 TaxID=3237372 RepID=UPI0039C0A207
MKITDYQFMPNSIIRHGRNFLSKTFQRRKHGYPGKSGRIMTPAILRHMTSYPNQINQDSFRMKKLLVLSGACLILSQNSFAETSPEYAACRDRAAGNAVQLDLCVEKELAIQDTRLNKVYGKLAHKYGSDQAKRKALKADELAWLKNRDEECQSGNGGVTLPDCELRKTDARADELESRLAN